MQKKLVLLTSQQFANLTQDDQLLLKHLSVPYEIQVWDKVKLQHADDCLFVMRTPWDYTQKYEQFVQFLCKLEQLQCTIFNPVNILKWNAHKSYLLDLAAKNVPIVPTKICISADEVKQFLSKNMLDIAVIKPAVGSFGNHVQLIHAKTFNKKQVQVWIDAANEVIVQPFMASVKSRGELSLLFCNNEFVQAVKKVPPNGDFKVQGGKMIPVEKPSALEMQVAKQTLKAVDGYENLLYARVDLLYSDNGEQVFVNELEVLDPELFLRYNSTAAPKYAQAMINLLQ